MPLPQEEHVRLLKWAGGLSLAAGAIHGVATNEHLQEWWGYGAFFLLSAAGQMIYGLALLTTAFGDDEERAKDRRALYWAGILANAAVVALYVVSRTVGIPFLGPGAGRIEPLTAFSLLSKAVEIALIVQLFRLMRAEARAPALVADVRA